MLPYSEFNFEERTKPFTGKRAFSLSLEQLSFLILLSDKLKLNNEELRLVEYFTYVECKLIANNRFRDLNFDCVALASCLYVLELQKKDYHIILSLIDEMYPKVYEAEFAKAKVYSIYRQIYNRNLNDKTDFDSYKGNCALNLKK